MKFNKKALLTFLCLAATFTVLAGCNKKTKKNTTNNKTNVTTKDSTTKNTTKKDTTKKTTAKQTTTDASLKYKVNEVVFNKYFNNTLDTLNDLNITIEYEQTCYGYNYSGTSKFNGTNHLDVYYDEFTDETYTSYRYFNSLSDNTLYYDEFFLNGTWEYEGNIDYNLDEFISKRLLLLKIDFAGLTFNTKTNCYGASSIVIDGFGTYSNIKIKFEDNVLKTYEFEFLDTDDYTSSVSATVKDIGNTVIESPFAKYMVNEETFNKYFNITNETLDDLNLTINYDNMFNGVSFTGTVKFNGEVWNDSYYCSGDYYFDSFLINKIEDDTMYADYTCYSAEDGWDSMDNSDYSLKSFIDYRLYLVNLGRNSFEFDVTANSYVASSVTKDGKSYSNVKIKFEDNKLVSFEYRTSDSIISATVEDVDATEVKYVKDYFVDEKTFNSYFNINDMTTLNSLNYTAHHEYEYTFGGDFAASMDIKTSNGLFLVDYSTKDGNTFNYYYETFESETDGRVLFDKYTLNTVWYNDTRKDFSINAFLSQVYLLHNTAYSNFTFNPMTMMYEAESIDAGSNQYYLNVKIQFENNKPVCCSYTFNSYNSDDELTRSWDAVDTFTYVCTTEVKCPFGTNYEVDKATFDKYFDVDSLEELDKLNLSLDYDYEDEYTTKKGTIYIDGCEASELYNKDGQFKYIDFHIFEPDYSEVKHTLYRYLKDNQIWAEVTHGVGNVYGMTLNVYYIPVLDFSKLTYNSETQSYEATNIEVNGFIYDSVSIKFKDRKLVSYTIAGKNKYVVDGETSYVDYTISAKATHIGETTVVNPINKD
ncbi:MAG: hypothetical protein J6Y28_06235 [Acholeplasmatales bacterium]|nr:hypothetical protein [Acholeplasmatales bacterium]